MQSGSGMRRTLKMITIVVAVPSGVASLAIATIWLVAQFQTWESQAFLFSEVDKVPVVEVGLVLGTSATVLDHQTNTLVPSWAFDFRLDAAAELWRAGKVKYLLVSGNGAEDEPTKMRAALIERGVPSSIIYRDYSGFRTLDSILRARLVFGQRRLIIVSQDYHLTRAIFLARSSGIEAWGYVARPVWPSPSLHDRLVITLAALLAYYDAWRGTSPRDEGDGPIMMGTDLPD